MDGISDSMDMSLSKPVTQGRIGKPGVLQFMGSQRVGHDLVTEQAQQHVKLTLAKLARMELSIGLKF